MVDELKSLFRAGLQSQIEAFEAARQSIVAGEFGAIESARRMAQSLARAAQTHGDAEIDADAQALAEADPDMALEAIATILSKLRKATSAQDLRETTVLLVEPDDEAARLLSQRLQVPNRRLIHTSTLAAGRQVIDEQSVALLILDLIMPDGDGRNLLAELRNKQQTATLPVFVVSALSGAQVKTECFALGADEYFSKPLSLDAVADAVTLRLKRSAEITRELRHDSLTGLLNRAALLEMFAHQQAQAKRAQKPLSIALLDIDSFKSVNDTYGHPMGDHVLARTAAVIRGALRSSDLLGRWGGDELLALLPDTDRAAGVKVSEEALEALRLEQFVTETGSRLRASFSAGVVTVRSKASLQDSVADADRFLYMAKAAGRNRVVSAKDGMQPPRKKVLLAEDEETTALYISELLEQDDFEVIHVSDGVAALKVVQSTPVSLLLLDVMMPKLSGFDVLRQIRETDALARIPIVMLTAMGSEGDVVRGFDLGADDYVIKPFSAPELIRRVRRLANRR